MRPPYGIIRQVSPAATSGTSGGVRPSLDYCAVEARSARLLRLVRLRAAIAHGSLISVIRGIFSSPLFRASLWSHSNTFRSSPPLLQGMAKL